MTRIEMTVKRYDWYCEDGCCSEHGEDVTYEVDGVEVGQDRLQDFDFSTARSLLTALGYKVEKYSFYMSSSYVVTAEKVADLD